MSACAGVGEVVMVVFVYGLDMISLQYTVKLAPLGTITSNPGG